MKYYPFDQEERQYFYAPKGKFIFSNGEEFEGYYYIENNSFFEKDTNIKIYPLNKEKNFLEYVKQKGIYLYHNIFKFEPYKFNFNIDDCKLGFKTRYFIAKKNNIREIREISESDFKKSSKDSNTTKLYAFYSTVWCLNLNYSGNDCLDLKSTIYTDEKFALECNKRKIADLLRQNPYFVFLYEDLNLYCEFKS